VRFLLRKGSSRNFLKKSSGFFYKDFSRGKCCTGDSTRFPVRMIGQEQWINLFSSGLAGGNEEFLETRR
jgi:hypothetical protein